MTFCPLLLCASIVLHNHPNNRTITTTDVLLFPAPFILANSLQSTFSSLKQIDNYSTFSFAPQQPTQFLLHTTISSARTIQFRLSQFDEGFSFAGFMSCSWNGKTLSLSLKHDRRSSARERIIPTRLKQVHKIIPDSFLPPL